MITIKGGQQVKHKLTGEKLVIKKIRETVATCYVENPIHIFGWLYSDTIICSIENLIPA